MALSINWVTKRITIPKADLALVSGTLYQHDTHAFMLAVRALEESEAGMVHPKIIDHNTEYTVAGVTYARKVEIVNGYSVEYENGTYSVRLSGSNNNIFDIQNGVLVQNQVQVIPGNAAGLQTVNTGGTTPALTPAESAALLQITTLPDDVWQSPKAIPKLLSVE